GRASRGGDQRPADPQPDAAGAHPAPGRPRDAGADARRVALRLRVTAADRGPRRQRGLRLPPAETAGPDQRLSSGVPSNPVLIFAMVFAASDSTRTTRTPTSAPSTSLIADVIASRRVRAARLNSR